MAFVTDEPSCLAYNRQQDIRLHKIERKQNNTTVFILMTKGRLIPFEAEGWQNDQSQTSWTVTSVGDSQVRATRNPYRHIADQQEYTPIRYIFSDADELEKVKHEIYDALKACSGSESFHLTFAG